MTLGVTLLPVASLWDTLPGPGWPFSPRTSSTQRHNGWRLLGPGSGSGSSGKNAAAMFFTSPGRGCRPDMPSKPANGLRLLGHCSCWRCAGRGPPTLGGGLQSPVGTEPLQASWGHWALGGPSGLCQLQPSQHPLPEQAALERARQGESRVTGRALWGLGLLVMMGGRGSVGQSWQLGWAAVQGWGDDGWPWRLLSSARPQLWTGRLPGSSRGRGQGGRNGREPWAGQAQRARRLPPPPTVPTEVQQARWPGLTVLRRAGLGTGADVRAAGAARGPSRLPSCWAP